MRALLAFGVVSAVLLFYSHVAMAQIRFEQPTRTVCAGSDLVVSFGIAGLGTRLNVDVFTSADVTLECMSGGRRTLVETQRTGAAATLPVDRNGKARGAVFLRQFNPCAASEQFITTYKGISIEVGQQEAVTVVPGPVVCPL